MTKSFSKKIVPIIGPGMTLSYDRTKTRYDPYMIYPKVKTRISNILQLKFGLLINREKFFGEIYQNVEIAAGINYATSLLRPLINNKQKPFLNQ